MINFTIWPDRDGFVIATVAPRQFREGAGEQIERRARPIRPNWHGRTVTVRVNPRLMFDSVYA